MNFDFEKELKKTMSAPRQKPGEEELTTAMHNTFSLNEPNEVKHSVFAYLDAILLQPEKTGQEEMQAYGITAEDIQKYRPEWENLK